ncbi:MAG: TIGR04255 family protein [Bacteroidales bacterium]
MSKLPNAPLLEVIFELRWQSNNPEDLKKAQYIHGDLYSSLKEKYPVRESLVPPEVPLEVLLNKPVHRFRADPNNYPLYQVGPGLLTLNTTDEIYYWEDFYNKANELLEAFINISPFDQKKDFYPNLIYYDFFKFDFERNNVNKYISDNFNIKFEQHFLNVDANPNNINIGFYYRITLGDIAIMFRRGKNKKDEDGIVVQTKLHGKAYKLEKDSLLSWLSEAHEFCSEAFKKLISGPLYESFKREYYE